MALCHFKWSLVNPDLLVGTIHRLRGPGQNSPPATPETQAAPSQKSYMRIWGQSISSHPTVETFCAVLGTPAARPCVQEERFPALTARWLHLGSFKQYCRPGPISGASGAIGLEYCPSTGTWRSFLGDCSVQSGLRTMGLQASSSPISLALALLDQLTGAPAAVLFPLFQPSLRSHPGSSSVLIVFQNVCILIIYNIK